LVSTADSKLPNASGRAPHVRYRNHCGREMLRMSFSVNVKGFGCRPLAGDAAGSGGRRPKASKGGNRDEGRDCGARYGDLDWGAARSL
jgi:hypothetical protein